MRFFVACFVACVANASLGSSGFGGEPTAITETLDRPVHLVFTNAPLRQILAHIERATDLKIQPDASAPLGFLDRPMTINVPKSVPVSARTALKLLRLDFTVQKNQILVSESFPPNIVRLNSTSYKHNLADLVTAKQKHLPRAEHRSLMELLIGTIVDPGDAPTRSYQVRPISQLSITACDDLYVTVTGNEAGHRQLRDLLEQLRRISSRTNHRAGP